MRVLVLLQEALVAFGDLDRVEVGALEVLDERELERLRRRDVFDDDRDVVKSRALRCAPAALAGDELEANFARVGRSSDLADDDRLDDAVLADRLRELLELRFVEVLSRLSRLRNDSLDRAREDGALAIRRALRRRALRRKRREERIEAPSERAFLFDGRAQVSIPSGRGVSARGVAARRFVPLSAGAPG